MPMERRPLGTCTTVDQSHSPPTLAVLHHAGGDGVGWAGQGRASLRVDNRNDFPRAGTSRLLKGRLIKITVHGGRRDIIEVRVGRGAWRKRDGRGDLLRGLDLVLQGRRVR